MTSETTSPVMELVNGKWVVVMGSTDLATVYKSVLARMSYAFAKNTVDPSEFVKANANELDDAMQA